jgi:hypothetical protein
MSPPSCSSQPKWRAFEVLGDDAGGIGTGPSAGAGGSWWEQMGTVYLVGFDHDRRVLREHTASSTQDTPGSIDIEWIPDGGSGFPGLSVRGLDDEDIYDTPAPAALAALCSTGNERLITACPPQGLPQDILPLASTESTRSLKSAIEGRRVLQRPEVQFGDLERIDINGCTYTGCQ